MFIILTTDTTVQGLLVEGKEGKRRLEKRMAEYDAASKKHLNPPKPSKWRKGEDVDRLHSEMIAAQVLPLRPPLPPPTPLLCIYTMATFQESAVAICCCPDVLVSYCEVGWFPGHPHCISRPLLVCCCS